MFLLSRAWSPSLTSPPKITGKLVAPGPEDVVFEGWPEDSAKKVAEEPPCVVPVVCVVGAEVGLVGPEEPPCAISVIFEFGVEVGFDVSGFGVEFACVVPDEPPRAVFVVCIVEPRFGFGDVGKLPGLDGFAPDPVVCVISPGLEL